MQTPIENHVNGQGDSLERLLSAVEPGIAGILDRALAGGDTTAEEGERLFGVSGLELSALVMTADELRRRTVGDVVTYVVNRNINFTNVCIKRCGFCAFSRDHREEEGYFIPVGEIVRRAQEAWDLGATEVCIQAGLPPQMQGDLYVKLCEAVKSELPDIHIHGFSPEEVLVRFGALPLHYSRVPASVTTGGRGEPAGDFCGDTGPGDAGPHLAGAHLGGAVD